MPFFFGRVLQSGPAFNATVAGPAHVANESGGVQDVLPAEGLASTQLLLQVAFGLHPFACLDHKQALSHSMTWHDTAKLMFKGLSS